MKKLIRRERRVWIGISALMLSIIVLLSFSPGVLARDQEADTQRLLARFYEALQFVRNNYVDEVDSEVLIEGAMKGLFEALEDPYSAYLTAEEMKAFNDTTTGRFGGVGLIISKIKDGVQVISPIEDTPAYNAGVTAGDLIIAIEGESVLDWSINEVVDVLRGEPGTPVNVTIRRGKNVEFNVEIVRDMIEVPTVKRDMLPGRIGYLRITNFTPLTVGKVREAVTFFKRNRYCALVIDVRYNPGGLLTSSINVTDLFLSKGPIVSTQGRDSSQDSIHFASKNETIVDAEIPIVVLINRGSASASEILTGALQDTARATVIGEKSYGKGSVQQIQPFGDAGLKLTTSRYYTPLGRNIDKVGITPDEEILVPELTEDEQKSLSKIIEGKLIQNYIEEHPDPSENEIKVLIRDFKDQDIILGDRYIRWLIRKEVNRTNNNPPVYDLEYDIVLRRAVSILQNQ